NRRTAMVGGAAGSGAARTGVSVSVATVAVATVAGVWAVTDPPGARGRIWGSWSERGCGGWSAADGAHRPFGLDEVLTVHAVAGLLAPLGGPPDVGDVVVAASRAQRLAQVGLLPGEQAGAHAPFGGQAG